MPVENMAKRDMIPEMSAQITKIKIDLFRTPHTAARILIKREIHKSGVTMSNKSIWKFLLLGFSLCIVGSKKEYSAIFRYKLQKRRSGRFGHGLAGGLFAFLVSIHPDRLAIFETPSQIKSKC
ncbi:hypothetical protein [Kroppenstedtia guangzhouensis]|uniref:hypothetical protein n=1 Tax=Kroppenstedtia guangzhouensis TaxID=1274356 RepID=UPI0016696DB0|nr:hypothetical protein [Kroppenstedtia guangzhouensis]